MIIITFVVFYGNFLHCSQDGGCSPLSSAVLRAAVTNKPEIRVLSYVAKAMWTLVIGVHTLACLAALVTAGLVIKQALSNYSPRVVRIVIALVIAISANIALLVALGFSDDTGAPAPLLLRATIAPGLPQINILTRGFDALSLTAVIPLCFAASAVLWRSNPREVQTDVDLARRMKLLRYLLYMGAVLLVIGVLRLSTTLNWGASFIPSDSATGRSVDVLVKGIVSSLGTYYTLLMAAMYLPAALILRARAGELADQQPVTIVEQETWLSSHGLNLSYAESFPRIIAILAPIMTGPFIEIIRHVIGVTV
ncbi:MAG TPA: hypothetical protein VGO56_02280 [Pyrinomonadaceae bacterium]|nr:hypothetical protein [Pyrinomonadaceae bacterium]